MTVLCCARGGRGHTAFTDVAGPVGPLRRSQTVPPRCMRAMSCPNLPSSAGGCEPVSSISLELPRLSASTCRPVVRGEDGTSRSKHVP